VVRALVTGAEGPGFKNTACARDFSKTVHPAVNGSLQSSEKEEWRPTSVTLLVTNSQWVKF